MQLKNGYTREIFSIEAIQQRANMKSKNVEWTTFFKEESEMVKVFEEMTIEKINFLCSYNNYLLKGTDYLTGFKKYYDKNKRLTDNQLRQCKRLAIEIYKMKVLDSYIIE